MLIEFLSYLNGCIFIVFLDCDRMSDDNVVMPKCHLLVVDYFIGYICTNIVCLVFDYFFLEILSINCKLT